MAHEIWQERFSQAGRVDAWHGLGTHFDVGVDTSLVELGKEAGLDYEIEVVPLTAQIQVANPNYRELDQVTLATMNLDELIAAKAAAQENQFLTVSLPVTQNAIVRMPQLWQGEWTDPKVLGVGSDRYVPISNRWLLEAFEPVAKIYRPETMGVLREGEIVFFTLNAGQFDIRVNGHDDKHNAYVYVTDRKTPGSVATIGAGSERIVCANTHRAAEASARILVPIQHSTGIHELIEAIAKALRGLSSAQEAHRQALQMMADHTLSKGQVNDVFALAWPMPKLSRTILALDTLTNPVDTANDRQIDQIANALAKASEGTAIQDRIKKAEEQYAQQVELCEWMRETAWAAADHMATDEGLGLNGYVALNAVSETLEHRTDRKRGNSAADMIVGSRADIMDKVSKHLIDLSRN